MRASAISLIIALAITPAFAFAQGASPPAETGAPPGASEAPPSGASAAPPPGAITREEFVQRRTEAAGRLFDKIDTNHLGYITRAQLRAWVAAHRRGAPPEQQ
jgi:hypothetical protein